VIEAPLGQLAVEIPPGAIGEPVNVALAPRARGTLAVLPARGTALGENIVEMTQFRSSDAAVEFPLAVPARIRMQYTDADLAMARGDLLRLAIGRLRKQDWEVLPTRADAAARTLTAEIDFACECTYAVLVLPSGARPPAIPTVVPPAVQAPGAPLWHSPVLWGVMSVLWGVVSGVLVLLAATWWLWWRRRLPPRP
jgi:hypothetical protein